VRIVLITVALALGAGILLRECRPEPAISRSSRHQEAGAIVAASPSLVTSAATKPEVEIAPQEDSWAAELRALQELAATDADVALARVAELAEKHERRAAASSVCLVVSAADPAKAMTAAWRFDVGRFADESAENHALERLARQWAETDLTEALRWAGTLPADDESRRDRVVKGIAAAVAENRPAIAAAIVARDISPDSNVQVDAAMAVLRRWAEQDYRAALGWAALFPEGPLRERGLDELASVDVDASAPARKAD
jgi:hypothetical protein